MGMYTDFKLDVRLKYETPDNVIKVLEAMLDCDKIDKLQEDNVPDHILFTTEGSRWSFMLYMESSYFRTGISTLTYNTQHKYYKLSVSCSFKNYTNDIEHFLSWIKPWINEKQKKVIGSHRYEEDQDETHIKLKEIK